MVDMCTAEQRSRIMSRIRSKDTQPEMIVRRMLFSMGYRYRLHVAKLAGKPDIVMPGRRRIIDVRGCFWHGHQGCSYASVPKSRVEYWSAKLQRNIVRDARNVATLEREGWQVLVVWECETKDSDSLRAKLLGFLTKPQQEKPGF